MTITQRITAGPLYAPAPHLSAIAERVDTEWVWRPGFGWVERPVVVEQPAEVAA